MHESFFTPEQEAHVRSIRRTCRGPLREGVREELNALLADGQFELARALDKQNRLGCGQDWNEVVLSYPPDGASHETPCPKCGTVVRWTSPVF